jgi:iron-sulfur cluster repair protein YtfE (RIC family)
VTRRTGRIRRLALVASAATVATLAVRRSRRAQAQTRPADVAFMYAMHAAMRRDISRLRYVSTRIHPADGVPATVIAGWTLLRRELEFHHRAEDDDLWPRLRRHLSEPQANVTIDDMVREHQLIPPALDDVARAFDGAGDLAAAVDVLATSVEQHLDHEERLALPLVEQHLTDAEWHNFLDTERRKRPAPERPTFLTWVLDDAAPADAAAVLRELPPPGRLVYQYLLKPRYEARQLWSLGPPSGVGAPPVAEPVP